MIELAAHYEQYRKVFVVCTPVDFVMHRFRDVCQALADERITGEQFVFMAKIYRTFLENYGKPPTDAESLALNLPGLELDQATCDAILCVYRVKGDDVL